MEPEKVPKREFSGFDPTFLEFISARVGKGPTTTAMRGKRSSILDATLPSDAAARLEQLRSYAGGKSPVPESIP